MKRSYSMPGHGKGHKANEYFIMGHVHATRGWEEAPLVQFISQASRKAYRAGYQKGIEDKEKTSVKH